MSTTTTSHTVMKGYTEAIESLPAEAFLGSLLYFSISQADVNLEKAKAELDASGLSTKTLRSILRPVDAFKKSTREIGHKFAVHNGVRAELMVRPVGEDGEQAHRHLILERAVIQSGKKRRVFYEKVGEIVFNRGEKKQGAYGGYGVQSRRMTDSLGQPLTEAEDAWLTDGLASFEGRFEHFLTHMDSHAVRTFVREYIYNLGGTCVKESGGLYFVAQQHSAEIAKLQKWVKSIGSEFHSLPLLNLADQREMILEAFEDESIGEVDRLMGEISRILEDPARRIETRTFDAYALQAAELTKKIKDYENMLGSRAARASYQASIYSQQVMQLVSRIRETRAPRVKAT